MQFIHNQLYIEFSELVAAGVSAKYLTVAKRRKSGSWDFIPSPTDARKVLVGYEALGDKYKDLVHEMFGNPYEYCASLILDAHLITPNCDIEYIRNYQYGDGAYLPKSYVEEYIDACKYLDLGSRIDVRLAKEIGFKSKADFNKALLRLLKVRDVRLPKSQRKFYDKVKSYSEHGASVVISKKFGNDNSRKVKSEVQFALLQELLGKHQNWNAERIAAKYNKEMQRLGEAEISASTVRLYKDSDVVSVAGRVGKRGFKHKLGMLHKRSRPSAPLFYVTVDGWTVELLYQERTVKQRGGKDVSLVTYHNRQVMVVVLDAFNNYPLGYAIGDRENVDLIKAAMKNAADHAKDLTGFYYVAQQVQSDNYGIKQLTPFYEAVSKYFTPAAVGNSNAKVVEPYFRYLNDNYACELLNWSGHNVDARKENQPNREYMEAVKREFPTKDVNTLQIHQMIAMDRAKKEVDWLKTFADLNDTDKRVMSRTDYLEVFGMTTGYTNKLTANGVCPTINGKQYAFDTFDKSFRYLSNLDWTVHYDDKDLSTVLVTACDGKYKYLLEAKEVMSMALMDRKDGEGAYLEKVNQFNKELIIDITEKRAKNIEVLERFGVEAHQQRLMLTPSDGQQKEMLQDAKGLIDSKIGKLANKKATNRKDKAMTAEEIRRRALDNI